VPTVHANGIDLHYERLGSGPPLLFLNGSGATLQQIAPLLGPYTDHFEVVIHDQRGLGRTEVPPGPYTMADYAADALAFLDHLGPELERVRVAGISFGGMVAQELAVTAPERVERLALLCTSPGGAGGPSYPLHELTDLATEERNKIRQTLMDTRFDDAFLAEHPNDKAMVELMGTGPPPTEGALLQLEARRHHDVWDRLDRITAPTLVASGRYDGIAPPENGEAIASRIPNAELRLFEGGHMFMVQDRTATPAIIEFLEEQA
jgi:pimeloyl-ACP methyl ester carboxylesterase